MSQMIISSSSAFLFAPSGKQYALIKADGIPIEQYIARTMDGVAENSHVRKHNYFYYNCLTGKFLRDNCPTYLREQAFSELKAGGVQRLTVATNFFMDELKARIYTKVSQGKMCTLLGAQFMLHGREVRRPLLVLWRPAARNLVPSTALFDSPFPNETVLLLQVILMDHVDWLDLHVAKQLADTLAQQVASGGIVIWRSASLSPPYAELIKQVGFDVRCISRADQGYMDRVNMYSSFFIARRKGKMD